MSFERDVNVAVQMMFKHAKAVIGKNIRGAIRGGQITIDESKIPGLDMLVGKSIDEAYAQSARELNRVLEENVKKKK